MSITSFSGKIYPNGEFTVGVNPNRLRVSDMLPQPDREVVGVSDKVDAIRMFGITATIEAYTGALDLGSSSVPISHKRAPKGLNGISSNGKRMVRNGCYLIEKAFGRRRASFMTATLPELDRQDYLRVCKNWGNITRTFVQHLKRMLRDRGVPPYIVYVTEFQSKRYEKTGIPYPHLHLVIPARPERSYQWYIPASQARAAWERAVEAFCTHHYGFGASIDTVLVKKSVGAYLSKYITKGRDDIQRYLESGLPHECIGHFWGLTAPLRSEIKAGTRSSPEIAWDIWCNLPEYLLDGGIRWHQFIAIPVPGGGERIIGMCGQLDGTLLAMLHNRYPKQGGTSK